jgi:hypothetical protein
LKKPAIKKAEKTDLHVLKTGKFNALDFYDVFDFFAIDCTERLTVKSFITEQKNR